jgi:thymidylate synthase (FAD)
MADHLDIVERVIKNAVGDDITLPIQMPVLDKGYVILEDCCGDDLRIANAARVSYDQRSSVFSDKDKGLINYLIRERHGSPTEMVDFLFKVKCPIAVVREWHRHRIASYNEISGRYKKLEPEFYLPHKENVRKQVGKQGDYRYEPMDSQMAFHVLNLMDNAYSYAEAIYNELLQKGVCKEQARLVLPVGIYTKFYFKANLRSLFNFFSLRSHETAMWEIREYSTAMESMVRQIVPVSMEAFVKHGRRAP